MDTPIGTTIDAISPVCPSQDLQWPRGGNIKATRKKANHL
jgi:hypothetical protein